KNYSLKDWKNEASSYVEGFFENVVEPEEEVKCTIKFNCKQRIIDKSKKKIEKAYNSLLKMIETKANKDFENYSIAFSEFGKAFVSNRFVFKTILRMLKYKCLSSTYLGLVKANTNPRDLVKVCPKNINKYPYEILLKFMSTKYGPREMILESTQKAKLN
ncbi:MAG: hypothetical protein OEY33_06950, partial [Bdellovibrionales bacterium]|nr:hypothetical protein [Bdellovibrionales bacterium]